MRRVVLQIIFLGTTFVPGSLSSASLVVERKTLVAAGHVTTQNLGGKKILLGRGSGRMFCCCDKLFAFHILEQQLRTTRFIGGSKSNFADEECFISSAVYKI